MTSSDCSEQAIRQRLRQADAWCSADDRRPRRLFYMIEITRFCSLGCPFCYASAGPDATQHLRLSQVASLGSKILADGGRFVQLIGGEPTEHPDVVGIVSELKKAGLRPLMATNGLLLGSDPSVAVRLKKAGLFKVNIQFDTLDADTCAAMRGMDLIANKRRAVENAAVAGLRVGLIATVCDRNVREVGDLLAFALLHTPALNTVTFQTLTTKGRFNARLSPVSRTEVLAHLLSAAGHWGLTANDLMPPPQYLPWRALAHPDCATMLFLCRDGGGSAVWPLGRDADLDQYYAWLRASQRTGTGVFDSVFRPLLALWRVTRRGARLTTMRRCASLATGRGSRSLCVVHIDDMGGCVDAERMRRCPACFVTEQGFASACAYYAGLRDNGGRHL